MHTHATIYAYIDKFCDNKNRTKKAVKQQQHRGTTITGQGAEGKTPRRCPLQTEPTQQIEQRAQQASNLYDYHTHWRKRRRIMIGPPNAEC